MSFRELKPQLWPGQQIRGGARTAMGAAVGYGLYDIAAILSVSIYVTFRYAAPFKSPAPESNEHARRDLK